MNEKFTKIYENKELYWPKFNLVAFAVYNNKFVSIYNHPTVSSSDNPYETANWKDVFFGAESIITFEGHPTAIVNEDLHENEASVYSLIAHELFHGHQYINNENRYPNELLSISYPLSEDNVELRNQERRALYNAVRCSTAEERADNLSTFFQLREKRRGELGDYLKYEELVETIEGPAWYVEAKAYSHITGTPFKIIIENNGESLLDQIESSTYIRKSCYSSGMFICLLLDEVRPDWKEHFFDCQFSIYELLYQVINAPIHREVKELVISKATREIISYVKAMKEKLFIECEKKEGHHVLIEGDIALTGFDPMNMVASGKRLLHQQFLFVSIHEKKLHFNQPVITFYREEMLKPHKIHVVLPTPPKQHQVNRTVILDGIGKIKGLLAKKGDTYLIKCK
ncbi:hypothetical protein [Evansella cellulosilytica]|uniref:Uncharacterized protein n=1 Tax=Evansella cellulosilytica (strain ATCC 21833 / DSM 2522 / FERM P-1141 / JCM 9156 / N-4) TaxID=649639 RepID=E6TZ77_EVAC2|nr:hypothetical protein [Evansella cellulosilytica]ADU28939.1 hypothetical protein Bcell_0657 [Evansella cellulosilytica DSM 2522]